MTPDELNALADYCDHVAKGLVAVSGAAVDLRQMILIGDTEKIASREKKLAAKRAELAAVALTDEERSALAFFRRESANPNRQQPFRDRAATLVAAVDRLAGT